ncbi:MAG: dynamin family protein [Burkholderiaceae bacterium]|nr:dynamin family protein [Burkholderiaceae bacterium]
MESLSPDVRSRLGHKSSDEEAYVVVFGPTQVGKTTLITDLMGVVPEAMSRVSMVLRGGRKPGKSATSTVMEYRRSPDARWGLAVEDVMRWWSTDEEMTADVGKLRQRMESSELHVTMPCTVCIPSDCFSADPAQPYVRLFDLPGDKPANPVEQEHVNEMARQYIPLADLILLVCRSDDLTFLQPNRLTLPGIGNWQRVPSRFRVVTTYSYAPQDVRNEIRTLSESPDVRSVRESLISEIERAGPLASAAKQPELFYPLEFGESWLHARERDADLYCRLSPLIDELKRQLRQDIVDSTNSWARLKSAASAHEVVCELMDEGLRQIQQREVEARHEVEKHSNDVDQCTAERGDVKRRLERLDALLGVLPQNQLTNDAKHKLGWPKLEGISKADKTVAGFRLMVEQVRIALRRAVVEARPLAGEDSPQDPATAQRRSFWLRLSADLDSVDVDRLVSDAFSSLVTRLDRYVLDAYWFTAATSSDYQKDKRLFEVGVRDAERQIKTVVSAAWIAAAAKKLKAIQRESQALRQDIVSLDARVRNLRRTLDAANQRVAEVSAQYEEYKASMEKEISESRRFTRLLDECYLEELRARRLEVLEAPTPINGAMALMAAVQLKSERLALQSRVAEGLSHSIGLLT